MSFWQMSFYGAVMILAVAGIRALTIHILPKRTFLVLWYLVFLRLLVPFTIPSVFSVYSLLNPQIAGTGSGAAAEQSASFHNAGNVPVWMIVWGIGVIVLLVYFTFSYVKCRREFETSLPVKSENVAAWLSKYREKRTIRIRQSGCVSTPLTYGTRHPVILMPKNTDWNNQSQINYVLVHELVHIKRFDAFKKLLSAFVLCIHWFNPLVWMMYIMFQCDIELACDETVVHILGEKSKAEYARTLIHMEETRSGFQPLCNHFNKNAIEERITAIMKMKKISIFTGTLALLLVCGTAAVFATSAKVSSGTSEVKADEEPIYVLETKTDGNEEYVLVDRIVTTPVAGIEEDVLVDKIAATPDTGNEKVYVLEDSNYVIEDNYYIVDRISVSEGAYSGQEYVKLDTMPVPVSN